MIVYEWLEIVLSSECLSGFSKQKWQNHEHEGVCNTEGSKHTPLRSRVRLSGISPKYNLENIVLCKENY